MSRLLPTILLTCMSVHAQTNPTGTWRVEGKGQPFPWDLVLRTDGTHVTGAVSSCFSNPGVLEILDGEIVGSTLKFKCMSKDGRRTLSFTGNVRGDELALAWTLQQIPGDQRDPRPDGLFSSSSPTQFAMKRVPDGELATAVDAPRFAEFAAAVNLLDSDVKAEATMLLPANGKKKVQAILVGIRFGLGFEIYRMREWRQLGNDVQSAVVSVNFSGITRDDVFGLSYDAGRAAALRLLLQRLADDSHHPEIATAPLLFWGHSGAAVVSSKFAAQFPERTIGVVRYHIGDDAGGELSVLGKVPFLLLAGGKEENPANLPGAMALWKRARAIGAPWTFAVDQDAPHGDDGKLTHLRQAYSIMVPWISAVMQERLQGDGTGLRTVSDSAAFLGDHASGAYATASAFKPATSEVSWLPDEATAKAWKAMLPAMK